MTSSPKPLIHVVDDDDSVRKSLLRVLTLNGFEVCTHDSAEEFIHRFDEGVHSCLILDLRLPGLNGLELQDALRKTQCPVPVVFMSGHGDIPLSVQAMRGGAVDFLAKPFRNAELFDAIQRACDRAAQWKQVANELQERRRLFESLTKREQQVVREVAKGKLNKVIAAELGVTEKTIKVHRASGMKKLGIQSIPELVQFLALLDETSVPWGPQPD